MTIAQINTKIWRNMSIIADDKNLMKRAEKYLERLAAEKQTDPAEMPREEFFARVDEAAKQIGSPPLKIHSQQAIFPLPTNTKEYLV